MLKQLAKIITSIALFITTLLTIPTFANANNDPKTKAYIAHINELGILDTTSDTLIGYIDLPNYIRKVDVSRDGKVAYALLAGENDSPIAIINTSRNRVPDNVNNLPNNQPNYRDTMAVSPDGKCAYTGEGAFYPDSDQIDVIDASTNSFIGTVQGYPSNFHTSRIAFTPDSQKALVIGYHYSKTAYESTSLLFIDTNTNAVSETIELTAPDPEDIPSPSDIVISPDGKKAYVLYQYGEPLSVIDIATNKVTNTNMYGTGMVFFTTD